MYKITLYSFITLIIVGCGSASTPSTNVTVPHAFEVPILDASIKQAYLEAINTARAEEQNCGSKGIKTEAPALVWNDALYKAAYEHSEDLAESNTFSHVGSGTVSDWTSQVQNLGKGSTHKERIENNGYINWKTIGENIAKGQTSVEQVMTSWMNSPGHCANIMNPKYTEIGMAQFEKSGSIYWTQNFGAR